MWQPSQAYHFLPCQKHWCLREGTTQPSELLHEVGSSSLITCWFRDVLRGGHQWCYKKKEQLQQRSAAVSPSLRPTLVTGRGSEEDSGTSEMMQEGSSSLCKLFCAALLAVKVGLFKLTAFLQALSACRCRVKRIIKIIECRKLLCHYLLMSPISSLILNTSAGSHRINSCSLGFTKQNVHRKICVFENKIQY